MGKNGGSFLLVLLLLVATWSIWNESVSPQTLATGLVLSLLALLTTNRFLLKGRYQDRFSVSPKRVLIYIGVLFVEIFKSGVHAIHVTITGKLNVGVVNVPTEITDPVEAVLVANAITLTPGTVTIDHRPGMFKVIWIDCDTRDPEVAGERIKASFERVFRSDDSADGEERG